jgi:hypothetical protein
MSCSGIWLAMIERGKHKKRKEIIQRHLGNQDTTNEVACRRIASTVEESKKNKIGGVEKT